jgi:hypothetical protein
VAEVTPVASDDYSMILEGNRGDPLIHETNVEPEGLQLCDPRDS